MGGSSAKKDAKKAKRAAEQQLAEQRAENARLKAIAEAERRDLAEVEVARRAARLRGGSRMLLSQARVAPEAGVTLGSSSLEA